MLSLIQAYRGFAAIIVVMFHVYLEIKTRYNSNAFIDFFKFGHSGVEFFFVLTGFILLYVHKNDSNSLKCFASFIKKRFIRIYPFYWLILAIYVFIYNFQPQLGYDYQRNFNEILKAFLLLPVNHGSYIPVSWTLSHEVLFYIVFSIFIYTKGINKIIPFFGFLSIIVMCFFDTENNFFRFLFSPFNVLFFFGCVVYYLSTFKITENKLFFIFFVGNLSFLLTALIDSYLNYDYHLKMVMYGFSSSLIILGAFNSKLECFFNKKIFLFLGDSSFSIYLCHLLTISFLSKIIMYTKMDDIFHSSVIFIVFVSISIFVGAIIHLYVEKPLLLVFKNGLFNKIS